MCDIDLLNFRTLFLKQYLPGFSFLNKSDFCLNQGKTLVTPKTVLLSGGLEITSITLSYVSAIAHKVYFLVFFGFQCSFLVCYFTLIFCKNWLILLFFVSGCFGRSLERCRNILSVIISIPKSKSNTNSKLEQTVVIRLSFSIKCFFQILSEDKKLVCLRNLGLKPKNVII